MMDSVEALKHGMKLISILDLVLRVFASICTLASAAAMGTTRDQTLPFSFQFFRSRAKYSDFTAFKFFVIANSAACAYLVLSVPLSILIIIKNGAKISRIILTILDTVVVVLLTSGASAATAIEYLAHTGNAKANWPAICRRFSHICSRTSGSLIASFFSVIIIMLIIILSAVSQFYNL